MLLKRQFQAHYDHWEGLYTLRRKMSSLPTEFGFRTPEKIRGLVHPIKPMLPQKKARFNLQLLDQD